MSYRLILVFVLFAALGVASAIDAQSQSTSLRGAWKVTHSSEDGGKNPTATATPSLFIFTDRHYSLINVHSERPRYQPGQATAAQKVTTFDAFSANAGTYEVKGNKLTMSRMVATNLQVEGTRQEVEYRIEGNKLTLVYPEGGSYVLTRLE